jgi:hypothetical protein
MYTQDAGNWDNLIKGLMEHRVATLYVGQSDRRDSIYNSLHRRLVGQKKLPDNLTVDRHPDSDRFDWEGSKRYAYLITFSIFQNNREAAHKLLSKEF